MRDRISDILEGWYLREPVLFQVLCAHDIRENAAMPCPIRSGRRLLEYNPDLVEEMSDRALEQALRTEAVRILLKHPYQRRPDGCCQQAVAVGSDITIADNYEMDSLPIDRPADYELPKGQAYEWYSRQIQSMIPPSEGGESGENDDIADRLASSAECDTARSELWEEDELTVSLID